MLAKVETGGCHMPDEITDPLPQAVQDDLAGLDDEDYRKRTLNYRNEHSHAIAPRLGIGLTRMTSRAVRQATELIEQEPGFIHGRGVGKRAPPSSGRSRL
mgnify:CR=1 FL=1